ncbi:hypothetical protein [Arthrobacter sp. JSM 101049]|uniref:hypothetical protein n=1 Tax=Arthrobacter sp. JSM 101049 TaxID=929097 RepID=UPI00356AD9FE
MSTPRGLLDATPEFERWEVFGDGRQRIGAMRRVWKYSVLLTRVALEGENGPYLAESRIRFIPGIDWDLSWFHATGMAEPVLLHNPASWTHTGSLPVVGETLRTRDERELPPGLTRQVAAGTLPGYGEYLVLRRLVAAGRREASWSAVDDASGTAQDTRLSAVEDPEPPDYVLASLDAPGAVLRFDREVDGVRQASHWAVDHRVVASEWNGVHSIALRDDSESAGWEAIAGLQPGSADFLLHGVRR